jgi:membrane protease YdiL (CAAX protease family)
MPYFPKREVWKSGSGLRTGLAPGPSAPWRVWEALAVVGAFALSQLVTALALGRAARPWLGAGAEADPHRIALLLPAVIAVSHGVGWLGALWLVRSRYRLRAIPALALTAWRGPRLWRFYALGLLLYAASLLLLALVPPPPDETNLFTEIFKRGGPLLAQLLLVAVILAPALEETLFRGLLLPALRRRYRFWFAALVVTLLFTALHASQTGTYWPALVGIFACGWALAWLRERFGSLWPCVLFHMGFNSTPFLVWLIAQPFGGLK